MISATLVRTRSTYRTAVPNGIRRAEAIRTSTGSGAMPRSWASRCASVGSCEVALPFGGGSGPGAAPAAVACS